MVDYETYCRIRDHLVRQQLNVAQTARALALDVRTVARWAEVEQFRARKAVRRASKLDAFKGQIVRWLDVHPYSAQQIYQRLAEDGYNGGITIVKDYVHCIRPRRQPAFLKLDFEPGECAQVDWGELGTVTPCVRLVVASPFTRIIRGGATQHAKESTFPRVHRAGIDQGPRTRFAHLGIGGH